MEVIIDILNLSQKSSIYHISSLIMPQNVDFPQNDLLQEYAAFKNTSSYQIFQTHIILVITYKMKRYMLPW